MKVLAELLSVLGPATKQIKMGRFSKYNRMELFVRSAEYKTAKFRKKLLGDDDIKDVLWRLDRLTQEEAQVAVTQTLEVVQGLVRNIKVVMDGMSEHNCPVAFLIFF